MQDATVAPTQSAPQVSQTQPTSYVAPAAQSAAQAPAVGTSPQWVATSQPMAAPVGQAPAQTAVPYQNSAPTAYSPQVSQAPQQQENPYKEAFSKVVGLLSSPVQFPFQGQQSPQTQAIDPASYGSQQTTQFANQGLQTSMPGINSNPAYSDSYSQTSQEITADQLLANGVSPQSIEIIDHFGPDTAGILNNYSCELEDAVVATNGQLNEAAGLLQELSAEHKVYERILTDPDILADYTCEFFGANGPYPVPQGQAPAAAPQGQPVGQQYANAPQVTGQPNVTGQAPAAAPQRPDMPVPQQPMRQADPSSFWNNFGQAADRNPGEAWKYLNAAQQDPEIFRQKLLVME